MKRREFMRVLGYSGAGVILAACGGGSGTSVILPNAYAFYRLFQTGEMLPGGQTANYLPGSVMINEKAEIYFHASARPNNRSINGLYEVLMDFGGDEPRIVEIGKVLKEGDQLQDGRRITMVGSADTNRHGSRAVRLRLEGEGTEGLFLDQNKSGFRPVVEYLTPTPDGNGHFAASLGNFDLSDNDDLLVSSHVAPDQGGSYESLYLLPKGRVDSSGAELLRSGQAVPDANNAQIGTFGLFQGQTDLGHYVTQVHTNPIKNTNAQSPAQSAGSANLKGRLGLPGDLRLQAGSSNLGIAAVRQQGFVAGDVLYGPRIGPNGVTAEVVHVKPDQMVLIFGDRILLTTSDLSPLGGKIHSFGDPIVAPDGRMFCVVYTKGSITEELIVSDGREVRTILFAPAALFGETGPKLVTIGFGHVREQVDHMDRLVFIGEFDDKTLAVMLGVPV